MSTPAAAPVTRTARKRAEIVSAARGAFLAQGYGATSMDDVAARAGVSKQTIYKQFHDKSGLFDEVVRTTVEPMHAALRVDLDPASTDVRGELRRFGRALVGQVVRPDVVALRAVIVSEADRFPEVATAWYRDGPTRTVDDLAARLAALAAKGRLRCDDPRRAAEQFMFMVLGEPLLASMFVRPVPRPRPAELHARVDAAVTTLLAAHPVTGDARPPTR